MNNMWKNLDPKLKRIIWVGSIITIIGSVLYLIIPESAALRVNKEKTIEHLLTSKDTKSITLQSMAANIDSLKSNNAKLVRQLDLMNADIRSLQRENGPTRMMAREVSELKAAMSDNQRKNSTILQKIDEMEDTTIDITSGIIEEVTKKIISDGTLSSSNNGFQGGVIPIVPAMTTVPSNNSTPSINGNPQNPVVNVPKIVVPQESKLEIYDSAEEFFKESKRPVQKTSSKSSSKSTSKNGSNSISIRNISAQDPSSTIAKNAKRVIADRKKEAEKTKESGTDTSVLIPAGSIVEAVIIAGMDAPTNQSAKRSPFPALMRVKTEALLPNRFKADIRECFLIASGYGDMGSERAYLRGETISCISEEGGAIEARFDSFSVGEDGKTGIRGRLVTKNGALIANAMLAGFGEGLASAFDVSVVPTISTDSTENVGFQKIMSDEALQKGAIGGAKSAMSRIADYYLDMAENITPVIEIDAGRVVSFITTKGISLKFSN